MNKQHCKPFDEESFIRKVLRKCFAQSWRR